MRSGDSVVAVVSTDRGGFKKRKNSSREKNLMLKKSSGSKCEKFKVHGFHVRMFVHM